MHGRLGLSLALAMTSLLSVAMGSVEPGKDSTVDPPAVRPTCQGPCEYKGHPEIFYTSYDSYICASGPNSHSLQEGFCERYACANGRFDSFAGWTFGGCYGWNTNPPNPIRPTGTCGATSHPAPHVDPE